MAGEARRRAPPVLEQCDLVGQGDIHRIDPEGGGPHDDTVGGFGSQLHRHSVRPKRSCERHRPPGPPAAARPRWSPRRWRRSPWHRHGPPAPPRRLRCRRRPIRAARSQPDRLGPNALDPDVGVGAPQLLGMFEGSRGYRGDGRRGRSRRGRAGSFRQVCDGRRPAPGRRAGKRPGRSGSRREPSPTAAGPGGRRRW